MKKALLIAASVSFALLLAGCSSTISVNSAGGTSAVVAPAIVAQGHDGPNPWTSLAVNDSPDHLRFAIVADKQGGERPGVFAEAVQKLNVLQPELVMCVGDLIKGYTEDMDQVQREADELDAVLKPLEMPFFCVVGNHDITNPKMIEPYSQRRGRAYYHFVYKNVLFLCLNTEDPPDTNLGKEQIDYVAKALDANKNVRWTFVFMHKPLWTINKESGWNQVEALLQTRPHTVFAGHTHTFSAQTRNGNKYFVIATTGGASDLSGPAQGKFDHIVWVTLADNEPRIANLMLNGIWGENVPAENAARQAAEKK